MSARTRRVVGLLLAGWSSVWLGGGGRAADYTWQNPAGGNWVVPANWGGVVPTASDTATLGPLTGPYTVVLDDARAVTSLTIGAGNAALSQTGSLTVGAAGTFAVNAGAYTLSGGQLTLDGTMTTGASASATFAGGTLTGAGTLAGTLAVTAGAPRVGGADLKLGGTLAYLGGTVFNPAQQPAALTVLPAGVVDFRLNDNSTAFGLDQAGATLVNQGTLRKTAGNATRIDWAVVNSGTVRVDAGTLAFTQPLANTGVTTMAAGATIAATLNTAAGGNVQGPAGATGNYVGPLTFTGGTLAPGGGTPGGLSVTGNLTLGTGAAYAVALNTPTPVTGYSQTTVVGDVDLSGGTLSGSLVGPNFAPADRLFLLVNDGTDPITGRLAGLPDGATGSFGAYSYRISYFGDAASGTVTGGNDLVIFLIQPVPEPAAVLPLAALAVAAYRPRLGRP